MNLELFEIEDGETHWIVAETEESAIEWATGHWQVDPEAIDSVKRLDLDEEFTLQFQSDCDLPIKLIEANIGRLIESEYGFLYYAAKVQDWLTLHEDGDMLCSTIGDW